MTTASPTRPASTSPAQQRPHQAAAAGAAGGPPTIDPVRLLQKYKLLLAAAAVVGVFLGAAAHYAWLYTYPLYRAAAVFQCTVRPLDANKPVGAETTDKDEFDRFMATQVSILTSERVLAEAAKDPRLQTEAPNWSRQFMVDGKFDFERATKSLRDQVGARIMTNTRLIELYMRWKDPSDTFGIVRVVTDAFMSDLRAQANVEAAQQQDAVREQLRKTTETISNLQRARDRLLSEKDVDSLGQRISSSEQIVEEFTKRLAETRLLSEATGSNLRKLEEDLNSPGGVRFADELRARVEEDFLILRLKENVILTEAALSTLRAKFGPTHRDIITAEAQLTGLKQQLDQERERQLRKMFDGQIDQLRTTQQAIQAQEADINKRLEDARRQLVDLAAVQTQLRDFEMQIDNLQKLRTENDNQLQSLAAIGQLSAFYRVNLLEPARRPREIEFPKIYAMVPAGLMLTLGLVGGIVFLRELLDQRVKGPADVAIIPRTRVLGMVPDASEDPAAPKDIALTFRDAPMGVLAESYRQARAQLSERLQQAGHRSLLVVPGMPGSGATTFACNLALGCAAADQRVLLIDANFRRPAVHKIFGLSETPGLADVLAKSHPLSAAIQNTTEANLKVLPVGSNASRSFERLGTEGMSTILAEATASFDLVIIDVAPAVVSGDAQALASRCDASMLVVRALSEKRGMVARLKNELSNSRAEFLGVLVNAVRSSAGGYLKRNIQATHDYHNHSKKKKA